MKILRTPIVFFCAAVSALTVAILKALVVGGLETMPPLRVMVFAACGFGIVAALIEWGLRDLFSGRVRTKSDPATLQAPRDAAPIDTAGVTSVLPDASVLSARVRPIVFREICPPVPEAALSFYGGTPVGPPQLVWPRQRNKPGGAPLSFIMQWNCKELAREDATGLLPADGVLYLFADLTWGYPFDFEFVHVPGPVEAWQPLPIPSDLPPIFGSDGVHHIPFCSPEMSNDGPDVPRLMPRWTFDAVAFECPSVSPNGFWPGGAATAEALLRAQHRGGDVPVPARRNDGARPFGRPFATFPHDYAAVRAVASKVIRDLRHPQSWFMRDLPSSEREAIFDGWRNEARERYVSAATHDPAARLEQLESDVLWAWMEGLQPLLRLGWGSLVERCVNISLGLGSELTGVIPEDLIASCVRDHALAYAYLHDERPDHSQPDALKTWDARRNAGLLKEVRSVHAPTPNHMFGPPSYVQGYVEEYMAEWVQLLELSTHGAISHEFGDGVLQFMIRPNDLKERRFERVELVASAY